MKTPVQITVTGAAGQICYALLFRLIAGELTGADQPIILRLLEVPDAMNAVEGIIMELNDCASPLLKDIIATSDPKVAFEDADIVFLVGSRPRTPGMERKELMEVNAEIFAHQGKALNDVVKRDAKILVVGNPANTNALIAINNAPDLSAKNFSAMTRLDHNRALSQLAKQSNCSVGDIKKMIIWGNHSGTQFPDLHHARVANKPALDCVSNQWFIEEFIPTVQKRGTQVLNARGKSSAASAANAALGLMRDWVYGTAEDDWVSMAVLSDGSYGIEEGLVYSFPVTIKDGQYHIVQDLHIDAFSRERMTLTETELKEEREMVRHLLA